MVELARTRVVHLLRLLALAVQLHGLLLLATLLNLARAVKLYSLLLLALLLKLTLTVELRSLLLLLALKLQILLLALLLLTLLRLTLAFRLQSLLLLALTRGGPLLVKPLRRLDLLLALALALLLKLLLLLLPLLRLSLSLLLTLGLCLCGLTLRLLGLALILCGLALGGPRRLVVLFLLLFLSLFLLTLSARRLSVSRPPNQRDRGESRRRGQSFDQITSHLPLPKIATGTPIDPVNCWQLLIGKRHSTRSA